MRKKMFGAVALLSAAAILGGCGAEKELPLYQMDVDKYVTLGDYNNLEVSAEDYGVDEDEWRDWLTSVYANYATEELAAVDRAVEEGDTVNIDYEGKLDGVAFDGGTDQGAALTIGSGQFIDGFEEGLIGVMPGETVDLNLTFPESYGNADLAGKETVFTVTVNYVIPGNEEEMRDEVVQTMGLESLNVTTVAQLKDYLYELLEEDAQDEMESELLNSLVAKSVFQELPSYMVDSYKTILTRNVEYSAEQYGIAADTYTTYFYGMTCEEYVDTYVEDMVRQDIALQAVANREGLAVDDEELEASLQSYADQGGYSSIEEFLGDYSREEYRNYFMNEKVLDYLRENQI